MDEEMLRQLMEQQQSPSMDWTQQQGPQLQSGLMGQVPGTQDARNVLQRQNVKNQNSLQNMQAMNAQNMQAAKASNANLQANMQAQSAAAQQQVQQATQQQQAEDAARNGKMLKLAMMAFGGGNPFGGGSSAGASDVASKVSLPGVTDVPLKDLIGKPFSYM